MFVALLIAVAASCPSPYGLARSSTIDFDPGSADLPHAATLEISTLVGSDIRNRRAELKIEAVFPYGANEGDPGYALASERVEQIRQSTLELGYAAGQIGTGMSAIGFTTDENHTTKTAPYDPADLDRVEVRFRVRTDCHPLEQLPSGQENRSDPAQ